MCHFVPSRRGRRGQPNGFHGLESGFTPVMDETPSPFDAPTPFGGLEDVSLGYMADHQSPSPAQTHLTQVYYAYFHPAHPFLPPFSAWTASSPPKYLTDVVEGIGLVFLSPTGGPVRVAELLTAVTDASPSIERVQAHLLLSIFSHAVCLPIEARECIGLAIEGSLELGLHRRGFSDAIESPVLAESARRTWWEIFVIDTLLATVQTGGALQFTLDIPELPLPCDDYDCSDTSERASVSAKDLDHLALFGTDETISSLAYRVEATIILRQCLSASETYASQDTLDSLDATISAWFHRWPSSKSCILRPDGGVDQIDHQTAMIMHCASIYLHFPRSSLLSFLPTTSELFCSRPPAFPSPSMNAHVHTTKVVTAAIELSKLASLSKAVTNHSPFFSCTLVLSSIIQLAILSANARRPFGKHHSFLVLNVGVLKSIGRIWGIAKVSMARLRTVALEVETAFAELPRELLDNLPLSPILQ